MSSAEKLLEFQNLYFDDELVKKKIQNFREIAEIENNLEIKQFRFNDE